MPWFIKQEQFTKETLSLSAKQRHVFLDMHKSWVAKLINSGTNVTSGYLVNEKKQPGGGGFLIIEATSYSEALALIQEDPIIKNDLVTWNLQEWIPIVNTSFTISSRIFSH